MTRFLRRQFEVPVSLAVAWRQLARVDEWPRWATHIRHVELCPSGGLGPESSGTIHLKNGIRSTFRMREFRQGQNWSWSGPFLWLTVHYDHRFDALAPHRTRLTWTVSAEGRGVAVFGRLFAAIYARSLDKAIPNLIGSLAAAVSED